MSHCPLGGRTVKTEGDQSRRQKCKHQQLKCNSNFAKFLHYLWITLDYLWITSQKHTFVFSRFQSCQTWTVLVRFPNSLCSQEGRGTWLEPYLLWKDVETNPKNKLVISPKLVWKAKNIFAQTNWISKFNLGLFACFFLTSIYELWFFLFW